MDDQKEDAVTTEFSFGWVRQTPDVRDEPHARRFALLLEGVVPPRHLLLIDKCPPIWRQANLGSCTAHGALRAYVADRMKLGLPIWMPSRLFQYYNSRKQMGAKYVKVDSGATVRDAFKAIAKWGACDEALWPYVENKFDDEPPASVYTEAEKHQAIDYAPVAQDMYAIKQALASGFPVVFGFMVYQNFMSDEVMRTGLIPMPAGKDEGGHCVCLVGYNSHNYFCFANSWGTGIGDPAYPGHFWMPPEYLLNRNLSSDFWVVRTVEP